MGLFDRFKKSAQQPRAPMVRPLGPSVGSAWIVQVEHWALRLVSFLISLATSLAIQQVESLLGSVGFLELAAGWIIAFSVGVLGYFCSRGLAYRFMQKEPIWLYLPVCLVVEFVEIACNYILAVRAIHSADWVQLLPLDQRGPIVFLLYGVLSVIPLFTVTLAVMDMDLERKKGHVSGGMHQPPSQPFGVVASPKPGQPLGGAGQQQRSVPPALGQQRPPLAPVRQQQRVVQPPSKQSNGVHPSEEVTQSW